MLHSSHSVSHPPCTNTAFLTLCVSPSMYQHCIPHTLCLSLHVPTLHSSHSVSHPPCTNTAFLTPCVSPSMYQCCIHHTLSLSLHIPTLPLPTLPSPVLPSTHLAVQPWNVHLTLCKPALLPTLPSTVAYLHSSVAVRCSEYAPTHTHTEPLTSHSPTHNSAHLDVLLWDVYQTNTHTLSPFLPTHLPTTLPTLLCRCEMFITPTHPHCTHTHTLHTHTHWAPSFPLTYPQLCPPYCVAVRCLPHTHTQKPLPPPPPPPAPPLHNSTHFPVRCLPHAHTHTYIQPLPSHCTTLPTLLCGCEVFITLRVSRPVYTTTPRAVPDATTVLAQSVFSTDRESSTVVLSVWDWNNRSQ